jgi:hypothetical protein
MKILGIIAGITCLIWAMFYDWQVAIILVLFFIALKSDMIILIDKKIELLLSTISKKL